MEFNPNQGPGPQGSRAKEGETMKNQDQVSIGAFGSCYNKIHVLTGYDTKDPETLCGTKTRTTGRRLFGDRSILISHLYIDVGKTPEHYCKECQKKYWIDYPDLVEGAFFYSAEFRQRIWVQKVTKKMVWILQNPRPKHWPGSERRKTKEDLLFQLNLLGYRRNGEGGSQ